MAASVFFFGKKFLVLFVLLVLLLFGVLVSKTMGVATIVSNDYSFFFSGNYAESTGTKKKLLGERNPLFTILLRG